MAVTLDVPPWFEALRGPDEDTPVCGPPLGPALSELLFGENAPNLDHMLVLWNMMTRVSSVAIPNAVGVGLSHDAMFIPGHVGYKPLKRWELNQPETWPRYPYGPSPNCSDIVVVGKHPAKDEEVTGYLFTGPSGVELQEALNLERIPEFLNNAYVTSICRFNPPGGKFKQAWVKESEWFLWAEIAIIKPKIVILLGGDAIKHFHGKSFSVQKSRGSVMPVVWHTPQGDIEIQTFPTLHPSAVARDPVQRPGLAADLSRCHSMFTGRVRRQMSTNYTPDWEPAVLRTVDDVQKYVDQCIADERKEFAIDCEWAGKSVWSGGRLLTVQLSAEEGHAVLIPIRRHPRIPFPSEFKSTANRDTIQFKLPKVSEQFARDLECTDDDGSHALGHVLRDENGEIMRQAGVEVLTKLVPNFDEQDEAKVVDLLRKLLGRPGVRVGGHNFRADFPWIADLGVDLFEEFLEGFDTMLVNHLLNESADQTLTACILKYTDMDRYDVEIHEWLVAHSIDVKANGFGAVPEHLLYPYALMDADGTFRVHKRLSEQMLDDSTENRSGLRQLSVVERQACMGILEVESTGMCVDRDRIIELAHIYTDKREELTELMRDRLQWPDFNPRSVQQCKEMLYGEQYNGKKREDPNVPIRIRPDGAYCAHLTPIKTTDKPPVDWGKVVAKGDEMRHSPSTDKESLGILSEQDSAAELLRRIRFVDQVVKTYVSVPHYDPDTNEVTEGGLLQHIDHDERIRTSIFQGTETGRWSSSRPNMQNLPKRREPELHSYFEEGSKPHKVRSVFTAPSGYLLVEADYMQAELVVLALLSGDENFWNVLMAKPYYPVLVHAETNEPYRWLHPEWTRGMDDVKEGDRVPAGTRYGEYLDHDGVWKVFSTGEDTVVKMMKWSRDLHAEVAISGFRLPYTAVVHGPPRDWMEGYAKDKRVAAKTVNFGIPYGRSAGAIARELRQEGVHVTVDETQGMIDGFLGDYPLVAAFLECCQYNVEHPFYGSGNGYLVTPHGRRRRFQRIDDRGKMAAQEREARNFPIQSTVADCLNLAIFNAWAYRRCASLAAGLNPKNDREKCLKDRYKTLDYRIVLGVHDALLFYAHPHSLHEMLRPDGMIDLCMSDQARVPMPDKKDCHGLYKNIDDSKFPYAIGVDRGISLRWDEKPDRVVLEKMGVPEAYLPKAK